MKSPGSQGTRDASTPEIEEVFSLAADPQLAENSRQGSERKNRAFALGLEELKSQTMQWGSWQASGRTASVPTVYLYEGFNSLEELDGSGNILAKYSQSLDTDEPLSMLRAGATSYFLDDGLRSTTSLSNAVGALANTYTYDAFGNLTASSGTLTNPFQFAGRESDPETGLRYFRARYYNSALGRFLSEDPIHFGGGVNFYNYARANPVRHIDPFGTCFIDVFFEAPSYLGVQLPGAHAFIALWSNTGTGIRQPFEFRGGPDENDILLADIGTLASAPDKLPDSFYNINVLNNQCDCDSYIGSLQQTTNQINSSNIPYHWTSTNSNAAVTTALNNLGIPVPSVPGWVGPITGWGKSLGIPQANNSSSGTPGCSSCR
jgi:RHS repeat-associated protein